MGAGAGYKPGRRADGGFTLVELVLVLLITGTLAGIAAPRYYASLNHYRVQSAARRLVADLEFARTLARTSGQLVKVEFKDENKHDRYLFKDIPDQHDPDEDYTVRVIDSPWHCKFVLIDIDGPDAVRFTPEGLAIKGDKNQPVGWATLKLETGGIQRTITIDGQTGRATIQ
ncbi:MAG: GspH/FimT family pseudopilin [Phycisphaerae bacterium]|nr:GspH/FimT family pseudopilin [Phycisphaerae bacterium]